ncbi:MAG: Hsp70 family protein [Hymenobacter sp.]
MLLVGGSTRVPLVYEAVSEFFGQPANQLARPRRSGGAGRGHSSRYPGWQPAATCCCST